MVAICIARVVVVLGVDADGVVTVVLDVAGGCGDVVAGGVVSVARFLTRREKS